MTNNRHYQSGWLLSILLVIFSSTVSAKQLPPQGGAPKPLQLAQTLDYQLGNGLNVTLVPFGNTPKAQLIWVTQSGNIDDGAQVWLADLAFELLKQGAAGQSGAELAQRAATMGGEIHIRVGMDSSRIQLDILSEKVPQAIQLLQDILQQPSLSEPSLNQLKTAQLQQLVVSKASAQAQADAAFAQQMFGEHAYGRSFPDEDQFASIALSDVSKFLQTNLHASNSHVYVVGKFDILEVKAALNDAFASMPQRQQVVHSAPVPYRAMRPVLLERSGAPQSTIRLGLPVIGREHPDAVKLQVMNTLLGGYFSSRITRNIREDKGYSYSPGTRLRFRELGSDWQFAADVSAQATGAAIQEVFVEILRLQQSPPSQQELDAVKQYMIGLFSLRNSNRASIASTLIWLDNLNMPRETLAKRVDAINAVTAEDIQRMAQLYLTPEKMTLVVVGDRETVQPQLQSLTF